MFFFFNPSLRFCALIPVASLNLVRPVPDVGAGGEDVAFGAVGEVDVGQPQGQDDGAEEYTFENLLCRGLG